MSIWERADAFRFHYSVRDLEPRPSVGAQDNGGHYRSVRRFVRGLRGASSLKAQVIIETRLGEECQVDYGTRPMSRDESRP